uniref:Uncharacterized protein n=1 Tax=viral metagenome TaxID=1070528 RepID=A0A6C0E3Q0_9ZZZZ
MPVITTVNRLDKFNKSYIIIFIITKNNNLHKFLILNTI